MIHGIMPLTIKKMKLVITFIVFYKVLNYHITLNITEEMVIFFQMLSFLMSCYS